MESKDKPTSRRQFLKKAGWSAAVLGVGVPLLVGQTGCDIKYSDTGYGNGGGYGNSSTYSNTSTGHSDTYNDYSESYSDSDGHSDTYGDDSHTDTYADD